MSTGAAAEKPLICLGEALVDLICPEPVADHAAARSFEVHCGGALANVAVAARRAGAPVALASACGDDDRGRLLRDDLAAAGVDLRFYGEVPGVPTAFAFAYLDHGGEPTFEIHGAGIDAAIASLAGREGEIAAAGAAIVFGSNTLVDERSRDVTAAICERARGLGVPLLFDPNLRPGRWPDAEAARRAVPPLRARLERPQVQSRRGALAPRRGAGHGRGGGRIAARSRAGAGRRHRRDGPRRRPWRLHRRGAATGRRGREPARRRRCVHGDARREAPCRRVRPHPGGRGAGGGGRAGSPAPAPTSEHSRGERRWRARLRPRCGRRRPRRGGSRPRPATALPGPARLETTLAPACPGDPRPPPGALRIAPQRPPRRSDPRARPDDPLPEHERQQPRRRLPAAARPARRLGRDPRRADRARSSRRSARAGSRTSRARGSSRC